MKRKLVVRLSGGLGNQMFQYAAASALARRSGAELVLDTWSGFVRDFEYRNQYELKAFPIRAREAEPRERIPFWLDRVRARLFGGDIQSVTHRWFGDHLRENRSGYMPEIMTHRITRRTWMTGYWQTARYFEDCPDAIWKELTPPAPEEANFHRAADQMRSCNSVAVGIRLYEECTDAGRRASGGVKSIDDVNSAAQRLAISRQGLHFFVFCTHRSPTLDRLRLPGRVTYVTGDNGFQGAVPGLWLLMQCRHHIITNSSFYWWGAWLSWHRGAGKKSSIFASDNFTNNDIALAEWQRF